MKILHIAPDEKFVNSIYFQFNEIIKNQNRFLIILEKNLKTTKYVNLSDEFAIITNNKKNLSFCLNETKNYDLTIFHGLNYFQSQIVIKSKDISRFIWFFWGGELYDNSSALGKKIIGKDTFLKFHKQNLKDRLKSVIRPFYYCLKHQTKTPEHTILVAAKKIKHFGIIHKEEVEYFKKLGYLSPSVSHFCMTYYPLEFIFKGIENLRVDGSNILLGNSSSTSNNHIEAFNILKQFDIEDRKLIVPLSYGDKEYGSIIDDIGTNIFGKNLITLFDFMSLDKYNTLLSSCNIVIMNHYRQQAVGNIIAMLWMGAKVYLDERNTFYHYLKRIGIVVFAINNDLKLNNSEALMGLSLDEINNNRQILNREISLNNIKHQLKQGLYSIVNEY